MANIIAYVPQAINLHNSIISNVAYGIEKDLINIDKV